MAKTKARAPVDADPHLTRILRALMRSRGRTTKATGRLSGSLQHAREWGWEDNIVGFGWTSKGRSNKPAIVFFVRAKLHEKRLTKRQMIPSEIRLTGSKDQYLTDVIAVSDRWQLHARQVPMGVNAAHQDAFGPGTLGLFVRPATAPGPVFMLSCSHVLAKSGRATPNDFIEQPFVPISNPAFARAAVLTQDFTRMDLNSDVQEDVALAQLLSVVNPVVAFQQGGSYQRPIDPRAATAFPRGLPVKLFGATASIPKPGTVLGAQASIAINDDVNLPGRTVRFHDVVIVSYQQPAQKGDSGAVVLSAATRQPCGLHFAGSSDGAMGAFFPLGPILGRRGLDLL